MWDFYICIVVESEERRGGIFVTPPGICPKVKGRECCLVDIETKRIV